MKKRIILGGLLSVVMASCLAAAFAEAPHWGHGEQETWWAMEDPSQNLPLRFPFAECGVGKHQSPVDLASVKISKIPLNPMEILYASDNMPVFYNSGHGVQVNTSTDYAGVLKIGEESFPLIQLHFHEPSEHVLGDVPFPAELHFVHIQADGRIAVLAVAITMGDENPEFQKILDNTPLNAGGKNTNSGLKINPAALLPRLDHPVKYYTLAGSLTTPPCSEGVQWYILDETITISQAQLDQLKTIYSGNARSTQELNDRSLLTPQ